MYTGTLYNVHTNYFVSDIMKTHNKTDPVPKDPITADKRKKKKKKNVMLNIDKPNESKKVKKKTKADTPKPSKCSVCLFFLFIHPFLICFLSFYPLSNSLSHTHTHSFYRIMYECYLYSTNYLINECNYTNALLITCVLHHVP